MIDLGSERRAWMRRAACRFMDAELFFPDDGKIGAAREVCRGCPVRDECLEYALEAQERMGVWGGRSESARRQNRLSTASG